MRRATPFESLEPIEPAPLFRTQSEGARLIG